jgi:M6 family metalloprotease-like protein
MLLMASYCLAVPADEGTFPLQQPDGSVLEARFVGDEKFHVLQTEDGYFLKEDLLGYYTYINNEGEPSGIYARNSNERSDSDVEFLASLDQSRIYGLLLKKNPPMEPMDYRVPDFAYREVMRMPSYNPKVTQGDVRGIVILVQFQDVKFKNADPKSQFTDYMNKEGYSEYYNLGSIRDYFVKNSMGLFRPTFDVYGPVTISRNRNDYGTTSSGNDGRNYEGARSALIEALDSLKKKESIDYSKYDNDGDGEIDFTYMFYAGVGANNSGVVGAIWPHAWYIGNSVNKRSGKNMGNDIYANRYACSNEIDGYAYKKDNSTDILGGIGTFAHEFSHVLGLPDMYDLKGNNPRKTPKKWDVMDNGNYNCPYNSYGTQNCAPPFYSAFERMSLGWMNPVELYAVGQVKLNKINSNNAYSITNPGNPDEMFLLEYRTKKDWDIGLPGSGMLIWHIDYVASVWKEKTVNNDGNHMYVDIEEAIPETDKYARASDAFPGSGKVTDFDQFIFWSGSDMEISLSEITEATDKEYITFVVNMSVSSSETVSSSSVEEISSSSEMESSSSTVASSSSAPRSSSSMSSSSAAPAAIAFNNGLLQVQTHGPKTIRIFSPHGKLLYETIVYEKGNLFAVPRQFKNSKNIITISQNGKVLFTCVLATIPR